MDLHMLPKEPIVKESEGNRVICYFNKKDWPRAQIDAWLENRWPGYERATFFDTGLDHKVVVGLPPKGRSRG